MGFKCGIVGLPNVGKSTLFNALTQTAAAQAANYPFCTIEPNVGEVAVPDPRLDKLAELAQIGADHSDPAHLRRYRRAGARRLERRGARQPVSRQYPRGRCHRACGALLRGRDVTHVEGKIDPIADIETIETELMLADLDSSGEARRRAGEESQGHRQGRQARQGNARSGQPLAGAAARGQAGAPRRAQARGRKAVPHARPAHLDARALCLQCRGSLGRDRQRILPQSRGSGPRKRARSRWSFRPRSNRRSRCCRRPSARNISMRSA